MKSGPRIPTYTLAKTMSILADEIGDRDIARSTTIHLVSRRLIELRRFIELVEPIVKGQHGAEHGPLLESIKLELAN